MDRAADGLAADAGLYLASAAFALVTGLTSTLLPHRAWGLMATWAYAAALAVVVLQLLLLPATDTVRRSGTLRRIAGRMALTWVAWAGAALVPLVVEAVQRAEGRTDRAQDEVIVVEQMGERLLHTGTPYLGPDAIAALPPGEQLLGYSPYQPGMAVFGLPRALAGDGWWTDARVWFAAVTAAALVAAVSALRTNGASSSAGTLTTLRTTGADGRSSSASPALPQPTTDADGRTSAPSAAVPQPTTDADGRSTAAGERGRGGQPALVRALQFATVLPICALTLATGGDDLPVLALCLLALAWCAIDRFGAAGVAVGAAAACKLFAFPVVAVLAALAIATGRGRRLLPGALGLPILVLIPPLLVNSDAFVENVIRFPLGHGIVQSPAQSPFPGYLISTVVPGGRHIAAALLVAVAAAIAVVLVRRPPRTAATAALFCGYGLLAAILLMPTTRFGYLLYPIAMLVWAPALRNPTGIAALRGDPALYRV
ncbi:MAG TPA: glycosyltransferase 87 family protein [Actinoplanes sp.]|nr:glycosyltransferase 87 family protein [Actinoplanes sp.]